MRVYWPSEPDLSTGAGGGLMWVLGLLGASALGIAAALVGGRWQPRWSWTDAAVIALIGLVGLSAAHALDHRPALNLAWDWVGLGLSYLLVRNLPRTRKETSALLAGLVISALAVAVYGIYQVTVELGEIRALYKMNPARALRSLGIAPGSAAQQLFENRLLQSNEPWSTFALGNSLAGYLVGPFVLLLAILWRRIRQPADCESRGARWVALGLAAPLLLLMLTCFVLIKSRSAFVGLAVGLAALAWSERRRVHTRTIALAAAVVLVIVGVFVAAAWSTGRFDIYVLTQSSKSLRYRLEYWTSTWHMIKWQPGVFWHGLGPGNFGWAYVQYKLPQASEEIADPHNLFFEVWATAGLWALLALIAALGLGLWNLLGPSWDAKVARVAKAAPPGPPSSDPPAGPGWVLACAGGGLVFAVFWSLVIRFEVDLFARWVVMVITWWLAVLCGQAFWRRQPIEATGLGAGALALIVNLLAAGGIGIPAVALMLWMLIALGLNLRDDRPCSVPRVPLFVGSRGLAFGLAVAWAALAGKYYGTVTPYWRAEGAIAVAEDALRAKPPRYAVARPALIEACKDDRYYARPWVMLSALEYDAWKDRGALPQDRNVWREVTIALYKATEPPRNPNAWSLQRDRAVVGRQMLEIFKGSLPPLEATRLKGNIVEASRKAAQLYPTNANLHALLAVASADIGMMDDAVKEGEEALRLDKLTPHNDKKLPAQVREQLLKELPSWEKGVPSSK